MDFKPFIGLLQSLKHTLQLFIEEEKTDDPGSPAFEVILAGMNS